MRAQTPSAVLLAAAVALTTLSGAPVQAQSNNYDLIGGRASSADSELRNRGYASGNGGEGRNNSRYIYWRRGDDCIQVLTRDGRVNSIVPAHINYCRGISDSSSSGNNTAAAVVAGVAIVGLAAAIAAHNRHHDDADRDHDDEYSRGYQAGLYGSDYDDRHETEGYHEGYLAGESEASNRRHANSRWVRGAPTAAQEACSRRADDFQNRPYGSSVPIGVRDLGRGEYELTMATGAYRSRCIVSASGEVRAMNPY